MIGSKRRMINEMDDELDDEIETATIVLIDQYRKRIRTKHRGLYGSIVNMRFIIAVVSGLLF
jgi:hypothetical protein